MGYREAAFEMRYPALIAAVAGALGIPFYLGLMHLPVMQLLVYSGVASTAMAAGQYADTPAGERGGRQMFALEAAHWLALISVFGTIANLIALIF